MNYINKTTEELNNELNTLDLEFNHYKDLNLKLDMSRGKPSQAQLDLSMDMMDTLNSKSNLKSNDNTDIRNYGVLTGIDECKELLGSMVEVNKENIVIYGNSSLYIMFDLISHAYIKGIMGNTPWSKLDKVKWLCPVPGYDRHFSITEYFNIEMINIPMLPTGPDMDIVEELVKDEAVKGIWCVPKYSNPDGITYTEETVRRFANLKPKAKDFRIFWDNAYSVHHLYDSHDFCLEILDLCQKAGNPDLVYKFTSTSKISFPGSGIAALATSINNIKDIENQLKVETIGFDKVNELRHVRFFKDLDGIKKQMEKHASILRPKFELIENILDSEVSDLVHFTKPKGGYFISLYTNYPIAKEVIDRCKSIGLVLTPYGSAFPYHIDPNKNNIRIAPSFPELKELEIATNILALSIKIESIKYILNNNK